MFKTMRVAIILSITIILAACGRQSAYCYETEAYSITEPTLVPVSEVNTASDDNAAEIVKKAEVETKEEYVPEIEKVTYGHIEVEQINFITLPSGTVVDTRLTEEEIDLVLRHFAAIENGNAMAFWDTLGGGQDGVDFNHWRSLVATFFPDWFYENDSWLYDFPWLDATTPPFLRGTGLFVREIDMLAEHVIRAVVTNDEGFEKAYLLLVVEAKRYENDKCVYGNVIVAHGPSSGFWGVVPHYVLVTDFIWRNYPSIFMSYQEQTAISHTFLDNNDLSTLPQGFILMDEPIIPYAPKGFSAFSNCCCELIIVVRFEVPGAERRFGMTRVYMYDRQYNVFRLVEETMRSMGFFHDTNARRFWLVIAETDHGPAATTTDFHYVRLFEWIDQSTGHLLYNQFIREPIELDVLRDEALEIYATLMPIECIITKESHAIIEARSLHSLMIRNKENLSLTTEVNNRDITIGLPEFAQFEGTILSIQSIASGKALIHLESYPNGEDRLGVIVDNNSLVVTVTDFEIGMRAIVFYDAMRRQLNSQYPPQVNAIAFVLPYYMASAGLEIWDGVGCILGRFDENLNYIGETLGWRSYAQLIIGDDVEIVYRDGIPFEGEQYDLSGRALLVFFDSRIRHTFPQVLPTKIYVLFETDNR